MIIKSEKITNANGIDTYAHLDNDGRLIIENQFDAEPILEQAKAESNDGSGGWTPSRNMRKVATVPLALLELWRSMGITPQSDPKKFKQLLNDAELRGFRTDGGSRL